MGSDSSKPSKKFRQPKDLGDPYKNAANRVAKDINKRHPDGLGKAHIATAVPNPKGKDPLIMMLRQNDEAKYAYDQQHYDKVDELLRNQGVGGWAWPEEGQRGPGKIDERRRNEGEGEDGVTQREGEDAITAPVGMRGHMGGQFVYAPTAGGEEGDEVALGKRLGGDDGDRCGGGKLKKCKERVPSLKGNVDVDMGRQAFVRRRK